MGNPETHKDNLQYTSLEQKDIKKQIEESIVKPIRGECSNCYRETLEGLNRNQVANLILSNYVKDGEFLPYATIKKDYTYALLVQTGLAMLGYDLDIDANYGGGSRRIVQQFERDNQLTVDNGGAGKEVLGKMVSLLLQEKVLARLPIKSIEKIESSGGKQNIASYINYVSKVRGTPSPLSDEMIVSAAKSTGISLITPELMTSIMQHETGLGIHCLKERKPGKGGRFGYYNVANIQYNNPNSREGGVIKLAEYLTSRYNEFKNIYPQQEPTVSQLLQNQGPDGKGFLPGQHNYKKPNPTAHGAYCADESKAVHVGNKTYPGTIASTMRKIESFG